MATITIPGFKGGLANSLFDPISKQTFQTAKGLDIFSSSNILIPNHAIPNDLTDETLNSIKLNAYIKGSDGHSYFKGFDASTGAILTIWDADTGGLGSTMTLTAETTAKGTATSHGMVEFLSNLWYWQSGTILARFDFSSISSDILTGINSQAPIFVHRGLNKMFYTVSAYQIGASSDITPTSTPLLTFDNSDRIVEMAEYGRWVAVGVNNVNGSTSSKIAIWNGTDTTLDDLIDLGDYGIQAVKNVNGTIYIITSTNPYGWGTKSLIRIYKLVNSKVQLVKELDLKATSTGAVTINTQAVSVANSRLYFGMTASSAATVMTIDNGVYVYDTENDILNLDRITSDTSAIAITSVDFNGGAMVVTWFDGTNYYVSHVLSTPSAASNGVYQSNAFPLNSGKMGKIKRIVIMHKPLAASCGFTVKVKHIGDYPIGGSIPSEDSFTAITTPQGTGSTTGKTQSTTNSAYTIIESVDQFKEARFAQIEIDFDEVNGRDSAEIMFPIIVETVDGSDNI